MRTDEERLLDAYISLGWAEDEVGTVNYGDGHFALVEVGDADEQRAIHAEATTFELEHPIEPGWYVVRTDSHGFIFVAVQGGADYVMPLWDLLVASHDADDDDPA